MTSTTQVRATQRKPLAKMTIASAENICASCYKANTNRWRNVSTLPGFCYTSQGMEMDYMRRVLLPFCISVFVSSQALATDVPSGADYDEEQPASASTTVSVASVMPAHVGVGTTLVANTQSETYYYGAPYTVTGMGFLGSFGDVSAAAHAIDNYYLPGDTSHGCLPRNYRVDTPSGSPQGGVLADFPSSPCGGGNEVMAMAYAYAPAKNLGSGCDCTQSPHKAGDPINLDTGNEYRDDQDASLGALGFERFYNSHAATASSHIGAHWRHTFDRSISYVADTPAQGTAAFATIYRPDGQQVVFTLQSGQWTTDLDVADRLTEQTNTSGTLIGWLYFDASTRYQETYSAQGQLLSITDTDSLVTTLTYSTSTTPTAVAPYAGLLLTVTDPRGRVLSFTYNAQANVATVTEPDGGIFSYAYDSGGNLTQVTYPDKSSRQYVYNESKLTGNTNLPNALTGEIDETGTRYASVGYNVQGLATSSVLASSVEPTQVSYGSNGTSTVTYPTGAQVTLGFTTPNGSIHTSSVSAPCGPVCDQPNAAVTFDSNGYPKSATDFNGNVTATTYDVNGLLDVEVDAQGAINQRTTNVTWNTTLRVPLSRTVSNASGTVVSSTQWVYNATGQTLARCDIDPTNSGASGYSCSNTGTVPSGVRRSTYTYCTAVGTGCPLVGLMLTATDPRTDLTQTTTYSYYTTSSAANCGTPGAACYQAGDLHTVTDPSGHVTTIASYDADGRVTRLTDANGVNTDLTYTPRGWLASRTVGGAQTSFGYTPYGAVSSVTDPDGVATSYGYDTAHRLVKITDAQGNYAQYTLDAAGDKTAEQTYDATGTVHKNLSRTFNTLGQLTTVVDGLNHTVFNASATTSYDANGNLVQSTDGLGIQRQLGYDALNRLVQTLDNYNGTN